MSNLKERLEELEQYRTISTVEECRAAGVAAGAWESDLKENRRYNDERIIRRIFK